MYPTIMDFAGLSAEADRPGMSWKKIANEKENVPRKVFAEYHGNFFRKDWYMLTDSNYKYTYYVGDRPTLFDMRQDPNEMNDLALDSKYEPVLREYEAYLRNMIDPEEIAKRAKRDLGLISPEGEDYTLTLTMQEVLEGYRTGRFAFEPEVPPPLA